MKTVCLLVGLISLCLLLFMPMVKTTKKAYSFLDVFKELLNAAMRKDGFLIIAKNDSANLLAAFFIFGFFAIFYLAFFLKIIFVVKNLIVTIGSINNSAVHDLITDEIALINNGHPTKQKIKNYRNRRKINGCTLTVYFLPVVFLTVCILNVVWLDALASGLDLQTYGLSSLHEICNAVSENVNNSMTNLISWMLGLSFGNFFFSLITFLKKLGTHYSRLDY